MTYEQHFVPGEIHRTHTVRRTITPEEQRIWGPPPHLGSAQWEAPEVSIKDAPKDSFGLPVIPAYSVTGMTKNQMDVRVTFPGLLGDQIAYPLRGDLSNLDPLEKKILRVLLEQSLINLDKTPDDD